MFRGNVIKDNRKVKCLSDPLKIPVSCPNTVCFAASFSFQATTNYSKTLQAGHTSLLKREACQ